MSWRRRCGWIGVWAWMSALSCEPSGSTAQVDDPIPARETAPREDHDQAGSMTVTTHAKSSEDVVVVLESRTHRVIVRTGQRFDVVELASKTTLAAEMDEEAFRQRLPEVYDEYRRSMAMMDASL